MDDLKMRNAGIVLLRLGMVFVFLWFGIQQLTNPSSWVGFVPSFVDSLVGAEKIVFINGLFEILASILLLLNIYTRPVALLLAIHLGGIAVTLGFTPIGVRDMGLTIATLAVCLTSSHNK